ncbi:MAG: metallophosphoesterase family protein [Aggregatilineales bacterium]
MQRIGIISDTHFPTRVPAMQWDDIARIFDGVSMILHAGDIETQDVLTRLETIAPVTAVQGDDDKVLLPLKKVMTVNRVRIGLMHSHRPRLLELWKKYQSLTIYKNDRTYLYDIQEHLLTQFAEDDVRVIVFGHTHTPYSKIHEDTLLFSPGAVYAMTPESARWQLKQPQSFMRKRMLQRKLRDYAKHPDKPQPIPSIGTLTIWDNGKIDAEIFNLPYVEYA